MPFVLVFIVFISLAQPAAARHRGRVLGTSTSASQIDFPPVTSGPGLILPDSPFYFLDQIKQSVRLLLAFTPQDKAKLHSEIAGERLAELRVMFARNNKSGIDTAINGLDNELTQTAKSLTDAKASGKDVAKLAKEINDSVKDKREVLAEIQGQAQGELKHKIEATQDSLMDAKTQIEDALPEADLGNEIQDSLNFDLKNEFEGASESAKNIEQMINELKTQASQNSQKALKNREEALQKAIEAKNEELKRKQELLLKNEKNKQEALLKQQFNFNEQALDAAQKAKESAQKALEAQQKADEIKAQNSTTTTTPSTNVKTGSYKIED